MSQSVLGLTESDAMAEAQYLIAQSIETGGEALEPAIPAYQEVAQRYPQAPSLVKHGKLVQYQIESSNYPAAQDLLERVFEEHPDGIGRRHIGPLGCDGLPHARLPVGL